MSDTPVPSKELAEVEQKLRGLVAELYRDEPNIQRLAKTLGRISECMLGNEHAVTILRQQDCLTLSAYISQLNDKCSANEPRAERTSSDYAIEHAEYFAQAVEAYRKARMSHDALLDAEESDADRLQPSAEALSDHWANVGSLMYEFRKRAERATAERAAQPPGASLRDLLKPIELDELIEWHKLCANCCERSDDFAGARRHRERRVELVGIRAGDAPTKGEAP